MAQAIAEHLNHEYELGHKIFSRGIAADKGAAAAFSAIAAAEKHALDLSAHIAAQLTDADIERADMLYTMTAQQRDALTACFPHAEGKTQTIATQDIGDPFMQSDEVYMHTFSTLQRAIADAEEFKP